MPTFLVIIGALCFHSVSFAATSQAVVPRAPQFNSTTLVVSWNAEPGRSSYLIVIRNSTGQLALRPFWHYATQLDFKRLLSIPAGDYTLEVAASGQSFEMVAFRLPRPEAYKFMFYVWMNQGRKSVFRGTSPRSRATFSLSSQGRLGFVELIPNNQSVDFLYTPNAGVYGTDYFSYRITDASGSYSTGTVEVVILPPVPILPLPKVPSPYIVIERVLTIPDVIYVSSRHTSTAIHPGHTSEFYYQYYQGFWQRKRRSTVEDYHWLVEGPVVTGLPEIDERPEQGTPVFDVLVREKWGLMRETTAVLYPGRPGTGYLTVRHRENLDMVRTVLVVVPY